MMVAWLSASKSVQSMATTIDLRAPTTKGTQRTRMSSTLMAGLDEAATYCAPFYVTRIAELPVRGFVLPDSAD
jgi:hypothetical protein